ncbi:unnamed protein product [Spirodela intermedia]|uniref:Uncharacterized protein n=1 Tax=Spirodela intermedia TaxID=51605 RepID=A0A7I8JFW5_SPIIN|nr:unnamed protein product [Spirodela intermedia]CAA6668292.1 unnamed protein product [Spirodela intermedia]
MRAPSLLAKCLPGLLPQDKKTNGVSVVPERDINVPSPAVEILPSKNAHPYKYAGENVDLQGFNISRVSVSDMIGFTSNSEMSPSKSDGCLKSWESSIDLVNVLKNEIRDGLLSFRGKRVLELGCGYGLPGICACLKGASTVHFQDLNAETLRCTTIPNVLANLEQARDRQSRQVELPLTPSRQVLAPEVRFYAGEWEELPTVLSVVQTDGSEGTQGMRLSFSEEDYTDVSSNHDESVIGHDSSHRRSRKLSGSRAWERATDAGAADGGYDVILITEIPYSASSLRRLYALIKKVMSAATLWDPVLGGKEEFCGSNSGVRLLRALVDEEGTFGAHVVTEMADREVWKFFLK